MMKIVKKNWIRRPPPSSRRPSQQIRTLCSQLRLNRWKKTISRRLAVSHKRNSRTNKSLLSKRILARNKSCTVLKKNCMAIPSRSDSRLNQTLTQQCKLALKGASQATRNEKIQKNSTNWLKIWMFRRCKVYTTSVSKMWARTSAAVDTNTSWSNANFQKWWNQPSSSQIR